MLTFPPELQFLWQNVIKDGRHGQGQLPEGKVKGANPVRGVIITSDSDTYTVTVAAVTMAAEPQTLVKKNFFQIRLFVTDAIIY